MAAQYCTLFRRISDMIDACIDWTANDHVTFDIVIRVLVKRDAGVCICFTNVLVGCLFTGEIDRVNKNLRETNFVGKFISL